MILQAQVRALSENDRTVELSFSSEQPYDRWFGPEILLHEAGAVDLTRLKEIGVLLFNHDRGYVLGKINEVSLDEANKKCMATVQFDEDPESEKIYQKVLSGTLKATSVGYTVSSWEEVVAGKSSANGRFTGPAYIAMKWEPYEVSIVSVPADASVGVGRDIEDKQEKPTMVVGEKSKLEKGEEQKQMTEEEKRALEEAAAKEAAEKERKRALEIGTICREIGIEPEEHIKSGATVEAVKELAFRKLVEERKAPKNPSVEIIADERDKFKAAGSDALLMRAGIKLDKPADGANELRHMSLRDLAIESLRITGVRAPERMSIETMLREALSGTGAFTSLLDNTVSKSMQTAYAAQVSTFERFVTLGSNPDFKPAKRFQISEAGDLSLIPPSGEFKNDELSDVGVAATLATFGKSFSINRQAIINDDFGILTKVPMAYVRAAMRGVNKAVYQKIGSNPAIYDGTTLFHANHNNLAGTNAAIAVDPIGKGREAMRKQKNLKNVEILNIAPKFLIVPASLETSAERFLNSISDPASANAGVVNPFSKRLELIADAELDAYSTTAWFLSASPMDVDGIEVTTLNGQLNPILESQVSFETLGIKYRIYQDYGVSVIDYRGLYKNTGV